MKNLFERRVIQAVRFNEWRNYNKCNITSNDELRFFTEKCGKGILVLSENGKAYTIVFRDIMNVRAAVSKQVSIWNILSVYTQFHDPKEENTTTLEQSECENEEIMSKEEFFNIKDSNKLDKTLYFFKASYHGSDVIRVLNPRHFLHHVFSLDAIDRYIEYP